MTQSFLLRWCIPLCTLFLLPTLPLVGDEERDSDAAAQSKAAAQRIWTVMEVIVNNHLNPPTRQEMLQRGLRDLWQPAKDAQEINQQLARTISELLDRRGTEEFLADQLVRASQSRREPIEQMEAAFLESLQFLGNYTPASRAAVDQQLLENRYVGVGIALHRETENSFPSMHQVFPRGPARRAGAKEGDLLLSIDGSLTTGMSLVAVIAKLRGQKGQAVSLVVRQPDSQEERTLNIVRAEAPIDTVLGLERNSSDEWNNSIKDFKHVAYIKIDAIRPSTINELRDMARKVHAQGHKALVLDLRETQPGELRHAAMVADLLLGEGTIGATVVHGRREVFTSDAENLFPSWPKAVLIDRTTQGQAEWIAASLQHRKNTYVMGSPTIGAGIVRERIKLPDGGAIELPVGVFQRDDGRSLVSDEATRRAMTLRERVRVFGVLTPQETISHANGVLPDIAADAKENLVELAAAKLKKQFLDLGDALVH